MTALWGQRPPVLRHCAHQLPSPVNRSNLGLLGGRPVPCQVLADLSTASSVAALAPHLLAGLALMRI